VPIHADVTAYCAVTPGSNKQVCQELVTLRVRAEAAADLAAVIAPLIVTDLPVVLLVPQADLLAAAWLDRLLPLADVLVTDSSRCTSLSKALERLLRRSADPHLVIRDIAYERLACWRELLADLWDETIGAGHRLDAVELEAERGDPTGVLLHALVSVALGHDGASRTRRNTPNAQTRASGATLTLTVATSFKGQPHRATFTQYGRHVTHAHDGTESCELPRPVPDDAEILHSILLGTDCDSMFERVLAKALDLYGPTA
ncbi:MAG: glucose-6-phosphate dehydrogenase assembly protein OpcA, partial [Planctomycetes bacterium]|nr:glucose-6-phosphate dehydrogenase assembly protein OpcA [Planctomycetota bacterium]